MEDSSDTLFSKLILKFLIIITVNQERESGDFKDKEERKVTSGFWCSVI